MATLIFNEINPTEYKENFSALTDSLRGKKFYDKNNDKVLMTSDVNNKQLILPIYGNGLLGTIYRAYSKHIPLILRPDDLWLAIATSFGNYVKNHSEEMRHLFVDHSGRKQLIVRVSSPFLEFTTPEHWSQFISLMVHEINSNVKNDIVNWIVPEFSTTTSTDITVSHIALMGTVSEYFDMKFELGCGLSKLKLEGTLEDWQKLYEKVKYLYSFGIKDLSDWADLLLHVIEQFINAYQGIVEEDFWQRICTNTRRGSGSQQTFRGWFLVFAPFNDKGKYLLNPFEKVKQNHIYGYVDDEDIVDCGINVQVTIDDHGSLHQGLFYAGLLMTKYEDNSLTPESAWIMVTKKHIICEDMLAELESNISYYRKKIEPCEKEYLVSLIKFSHYVAEFYHFPNDKLIDLVKECIIYYQNYFIKSDTSVNYKEFLEWLAEKIHFGFQPNMYAKYIDPTQINDVLTNYINQ